MKSGKYAKEIHEFLINGLINWSNEISRNEKNIHKYKSDAIY